MFTFKIKYKNKTNFLRSDLVDIIDLVSPAHKAGVTIENLATPLITGKSYEFKYEKKEHADKLAAQIFQSFGNTIDIHKDY